MNLSQAITLEHKYFLTNAMTCPRASAHLVVGKHHLGRCLHIFTMARYLQRGNQIPLNFTSGTILVLKPILTRTQGTTGGAFESGSDLTLFNETGDMLLKISFSTTRITFKDYARRSLGDGQGKAQSVDMNAKSTCGNTVSIHHYLTDSKFGRYQILLNGITVYHFDKRLPGPATQISYMNDSDYWGPDYWDVDVYQIDDLLPEDRLALAPGR